MKKFGLIGYPLSHSFSKPYFEEKFRKLSLSGHSFETFEMKDISDFPALIRREKDLKGLSVTIPHKEAVIPFLTRLEAVAEEIGAVNCIKIEGESLTGYNTDAFGFRQSLRPFLDSNHTRALVFGTGGASKAIAYVLRSMGISLWFVSRSKGGADTISYSDVTEEVIASCKLLVNCTPVGMWPREEDYLSLPYSAITPQHLAYDLIYNPSDTVFLQKARERGALVSNGYNMLVFQAEEAWRIWNA
jgi:shikimate dehydrogenase